MFCTRCGSPNDDDWIYCCECGMTLKKDALTSGEPNNHVGQVERSQHQSNERRHSPARKSWALVASVAVVLVLVGGWFFIEQNQSAPVDPPEAMETADGGQDQDTQDVALEADDVDAWAGFPQTFTFASGAGGWSTDMEVAADGTFTGYFHDSEMGDTGAGYPNGTRYETHFIGEFTAPVKVNEHEYSMQLKRLEIADDPGETIEDGVRIVHVTDNVYGLGAPTNQPTGTYSLHLPGQSTAAFSDAVKMWLFIQDGDSPTTDFYAIVNSSDPDDELAFRTY